MTCIPTSQLQQVTFVIHMPVYHWLNLRHTEDSDPTSKSAKARSQSVPIVSRSRDFPHLRRSNTSSGRLDTLHRALMQVDRDGSQMPVEDLLHATKLIHQIGTALNEKMTRKFGQHGPSAGVAPTTPNICLKKFLHKANPQPLVRVSTAMAGFDRVSRDNIYRVRTECTETEADNDDDGTE